MEGAAMARFIVRPVMGQQAMEGSGAEGANGTVVYAETAAKAREIGMKKLGARSVTVQEMDDIVPVIGGDRPLTEEEAAEIWNQGASVVPGSWESA